MEFSFEICRNSLAVQALLGKKANTPLHMHTHKPHAHSHTHSHTHTCTHTYTLRHRQGIHTNKHTLSDIHTNSLTDTLILHTNILTFFSFIPFTGKSTKYEISLMHHVYTHTLPAGTLRCSNTHTVLLGEIFQSIITPTSSIVYSLSQPHQILTLFSPIKN